MSGNIVTNWIGKYINLMAYIAPYHAGKFGYKIFGRPFSRAIKPSEKKFLNNSDQFSFHYKGIQIQGYRWGYGGTKNSASTWVAESFCSLEKLDKKITGI